MNLTFDKSFSKKIDKLKNKELASKLIKVISDCEKANSISDIRNIKKLIGFKNYYRIKINDYRIGLEIQENNIDFITIAHRKDIYNLFP